MTELSPTAQAEAMTRAGCLVCFMTAEYENSASCLLELQLARQHLAVGEAVILLTRSLHHY